VGGALTAPWIVPAGSLGRTARAAASERITLGVIGIGPRCTYDLKAMLKLTDVQCVAVCDVQKSRREAGKRLVDDHYGQNDCKTYDRRPLARPGHDPGRPRREGRLLREALRPDDRPVPKAGRHDP
jgi:hypothetical protein